jgi:hypothetical protein
MENWHHCSGMPRPVPRRWRRPSGQILGQKMAAPRQLPQNQSAQNQKARVVLTQPVQKGMMQRALNPGLLSQRGPMQKALEPTRMSQTIQSAPNPRRQLQGGPRVERPHPVTRWVGCSAPIASEKRQRHRRPRTPAAHFLLRLRFARADRRSASRTRRSHWLAVWILNRR